MSLKCLNVSMEVIYNDIYVSLSRRLALPTPVCKIVETESVSSDGTLTPDNLTQNNTTPTFNTLYNTPPHNNTYNHSVSTPLLNNTTFSNTTPQMNQAPYNSPLYIKQHMQTHLHHTIIQHIQAHLHTTNYTQIHLPCPTIHPTIYQNKDTKN